MKVLIAYDGSDCSKGAIRDLAKAGLAADTEAVVFAVAEMFVYVPAPVAAGLGDVLPSQDVPLTVRRLRAFAANAAAESRATAAEGAELVRSQFPGWKVSTESTTDTAGSAVVEKAAKLRADLVVVGSHGRSALGRLFLGSVSQQTLSYASCSVRVGRCGGAGSDSPPRLILAIDGSPASAAAVEAIMLRTWPAGTQVRVVTAVDFNLIEMMPAFGFQPECCLDEEPEAMFCRRADTVAEALRGVGLSAKTAVIVGDPKRVLLDEAEQWGADCIFIGAKGHGRVEKLLLGSVSSAVAARAKCSVEVVR